MYFILNQTSEDVCECAEADEQEAEQAERAISFYKREEFEIQHSGLDEATGEKDYVMTWQHK